MEIITEADFERDWKPIDKSSYTEQEREEIEKLVYAIFCEHFFEHSKSSYSYIMGMRSEVEYLESCYDDCLTNDVSMIHSLAVPMRYSQGSITHTCRRGISYALFNRNMKLQDFRCRQFRPGILMNLVATSGIESEVKFRVVLRLKFGSNSDGFDTVTELLNALRNWVAVAKILDSRYHSWYACDKLESHWSHYGEVICGDTAAFTVVPHTYPEVRFELTPMWSMGEPFMSVTQLGQYLRLPKPKFSVTPYDKDSAPDEPLDHRALPRGLGDYLVDHSYGSSDWIVYFSEALGIFYKVTVQLTGTTFDDSCTLSNACKVITESNKYIIAEIEKMKSLALSAEADAAESDPKHEYGDDPFGICSDS